MDKQKVVRLLFREPAIINAAQVVGNAAAAVAGALAIMGGFPNLLTGTIGPIMAVGVGSVLVVGGVVGAFAVLAGFWWLERVALLVVGLGWVLMVPAIFAYAASGRAPGSIWLIVALLITALTDVFKRYRRIDWAYLDPAR